MGFSHFQNFLDSFNLYLKLRLKILFVKTHLDASSHKTLKVNDVFENEIVTLVNEEKAPGTSETEFTVGQDSSPDILNGVFFYRFHTGSFIKTKKNFLLR